MSETLFGIVPAGQPLITSFTSMPSPTSFLYTLPAINTFSHISVFLLPNIGLPENTAAAIYLVKARDLTAAAQSGLTPSLKFLGGIGPGKESALYKVGIQNSGPDDNDYVLVISVESADSVNRSMQQLSADKVEGANAALDAKKPSTAILAQRIIQNAFNFLSSFTGSHGPTGVEVVPLKAFEEWWKKFEARIRADPTFLEKQMD